jgi:hypothetical protein
MATKKAKTLMKINLFALGRAFRALIITAVIFSIVGFLVYPELVSYSPENPDLLSHQHNFAIATVLIGALTGGLVYWNSTRR